MKQQALEHGLSASEYDNILSILGREPNITELGIFSAMWSEHCSYKSSRFWLKTMHTQEDWVICGPGENAGVVDIGDGQAIIFKIESHNHPSYIEPFQGAATGVGGILRDVFTMGARPIAIMNALRFGAIDNPRTKYLLSGVVKGISYYGNCIGIPTIGGETEFDQSYNGNILVNAMTLGLADKDKIYYSAAAGIGNNVMYVGARTGRDGIHGASMASKEFDEHALDQRPTVQVGDPFTEKLLLEACLELMQKECIIAIQDMGAAGLTSSSVEMADKGQVGIRLDLDKVPMRESTMTPYELMLSESQERMLMVVKPGKEDEVTAIFDKWNLSSSIIGEITDTQALDLYMHGEHVAHIDVPPLVNESPLYERPYHQTPAKNCAFCDDEQAELAPFLMQFFNSEHGSGRGWISSQYDYLIGGQTLSDNHGDASLVKVPNSQKAIAISVDCTPRYVKQHPFNGGMIAVAETYRNIIATGGRPLAITNNLNFGNPERPHIMGQIVGAIQGITDACKILRYPVISGNVSLYNETDGQAINPTPVIGGVGVLDNYTDALSLHYNNGDALFLVGTPSLDISSSRYLYSINPMADTATPPIDCALLQKHSTFILAANNRKHLTACHDISDGGLSVALCEMAITSNIGVKACTPSQYNDKRVSFWMAEEQMHYIIAVNDKNAITQLARDMDVPLYYIGQAGGHDILIDDEIISLDSLQHNYHNWLYNYMEGSNHANE